MNAFFTLLWLLASASTLAAGGQTLRYEVDGEAFDGWFSSPRSEAPLILLVHDWDGLTDYEIRRAQMLVERGCAVFAVDLFGAGIRPTGLDDKRRLTGGLYADRPRMRNLLRGALAAARDVGARTDNALAMGYCFGGSAVLELARSGADLKGFVAFHGGLETPDGQDYSSTKGHLLILHGAADQSVPMEQVATLVKELEVANVSHELIVYSGAPHAFTVFGSERYREDADRKSWKRFVEFIEETLTPADRLPSK